MYQERRREWREGSMESNIGGGGGMLGIEGGWKLMGMIGIVGGNIGAIGL